jgi:ElaB/YqjD/DUF883 family membrane-anchored ribosome-binding protein
MLKKEQEGMAVNKRAILTRGLQLGTRLYLRELDRRRQRRAQLRSRRNWALAFAGGAGLGAALMYLLDPDRGRRRRHLLNDQVGSLMSRSDDMIGKRARDLRNRARGLLAETRARIQHEEVDDEVLVERVRSRIGRVVSHPHAIEVAAHQGYVTLQGPILASEVEGLLSAVAAVRSVISVENRLDVRQRADDMPGLQGRNGTHSSEKQDTQRALEHDEGPVQ